MELKAPQMEALLESIEKLCDAAADFRRAHAMVYGKPCSDPGVMLGLARMLSFCIVRTTNYATGCGLDPASELGQNVDECTEYVMETVTGDANG